MIIIFILLLLLALFLFNLFYKIVNVHLMIFLYYIRCLKTIVSDIDFSVSLFSKRTVNGYPIFY